MGHRPALGHIKVEKLGKLRCGRAGGGVAPGAEGHQELTILVKGQVAVHHGREAHAAHLGERFPIFFLDICRQVCIGIPETVPDLVKRIGPVVVDVAIFPAVVARRQGSTLGVDEDGLDPGGAKFNSKETILCHMCAPFRPIFCSCAAAPRSGSPGRCRSWPPR